MEQDRRQGLGEHVDAWQRERGHLDDGPEGVALAATLNAEQADRVCLVQVQSYGPAHDFAQDTELG
jgi:hypothetical protein